MNEGERGGEGTGGSALRESQSGGTSGDFGGNRDQRQSDAQGGGGAHGTDLDQAGGSSGTGGYGNAQNQQNHQGQHDQAGAGASDPGQSRGERFDEMQGGGRGGDSISSDEGGDPAANAEIDSAVDELMQDGRSDAGRSGGEEEEAQG